MRSGSVPATRPPRTDLPAEPYDGHPLLWVYAQHLGALAGWEHGHALPRGDLLGRLLRVDAARAKGRLHAVDRLLVELER